MGKPGSLLLAALVLAALVALAGPAQALEDEWNQDVVTSLAKKFEGQVDELFQKARIENQEIAFGTRIQSHLLVDDMRTLRRHARALTRHLQAGASKEESLPLFQRMQVIIHQLHARAPRTQLLSSSQPELDKARGTLNELRAFYGVEPLPPPVAAQQAE